MRNNDSKVKNGWSLGTVWRLMQWILLAVAPATVHASNPLQDPTRPASHSTRMVQGEASLQLQAVFLHEAGNRAVVDGRLIQVGDRIANMRVQSIAANKVRLVDGEKVREVTLRPKILSMPESEDPL